MLPQPELCEFRKPGSRLPVIAPGINADPSAGKEFTGNFNIPGLQKLYQVIQDNIYAIFMKRSMISETEKV